MKDDGLLALRSKLAATEPNDIIARTCAREQVAAVCAYVDERRANGHVPAFGFLLPPDLADRFLGEGAWIAIRNFCLEEFGDDFLPAPYVLECLYRVYRPENAGAWIWDTALLERATTLCFDSDNLLVGPVDRVEFAKEGALTDEHWILFDRQVPGIGVSGGFVEALLMLERSLRPVRHFGLAVSNDCILARDLHFNLYTRAFIRGPRCPLDDATLQSPRFPEIARGTITVHERVDVQPIHVLYPIIRTEFMWSRRDNVKSIQIEELTPVSAARGTSVNRYLHAIWDVERGCFVRLDGAIRTYSEANLQNRLKVDLRHYDAKADHYKKLFRIDADLSIAQWADITARYFDPNELVLEYLEDPHASVDLH